MDSNASQDACFYFTDASLILIPGIVTACIHNKPGTVQLILLTALWGKLTCNLSWRLTKVDRFSALSTTGTARSTVSLQQALQIVSLRKLS